MITQRRDEPESELLPPWKPPARPRPILCLFLFFVGVAAWNCLIIFPLLDLMFIF